MSYFKTAQKGKCFVCGKSTKLPVHSECGQKATSDSTRLQRERNHKANRERYRQGNVPWFCLK